MTTDATTFAPARPLSINSTPLLFGVIAFAVSVGLLLVVLMSPDTSNASETSFSPAALSFTRSINMRMSELSSVYLETASARDERPLPPPPPEPIIYIVQRGDTLRSIAARFLGDERRWREIFEANRATISNPDLIRPGMELVIPIV